MLHDLELKFSQHETRVRRAEEQARLMAALKAGRSAKDDHSPSRRVSVLLRRLAGTAASA
jgi:hypothetical protein